MKIPRDLSADELINTLHKIGFAVTRQKGSHVRLTAIVNSEKLHITIPNHSPIKIGTLNNILSDVSTKLGIDKQDLLKSLFNK